jgi:hypothetical protein
MYPYQPASGAAAQHAASGSGSPLSRPPPAAAAMAAPAPSIAMASSGGCEPLDFADLGRHVYNAMQQPGAVVRSPAEHSRAPLALLPTRVGSDPDFTAADVIRNVEFRARCFDISLQGLQQLLASVMGQQLLPHVAAQGVRPLASVLAQTTCIMHCTKQRSMLVLSC